MPALRNIVQSCRRTARNRSCTRRYPTDTGFVTDTLAYTANSKTTSNARGGVRTEVVNGLGKLKTLTERTTGSATSVLTYEYDGFGNLTRTTDSGGNPTTITYDLLGRKKQLADKDLGTLNYTLDALGQTVTQTDAKGQLAAFEYDALRRLTKRTEAGVITGQWSFDTCQNGRLCTATAPNSSRTHTYDAVGRLTNTSTLNNGQSFASTRRYDSYGRLQAEVHTQGTRVPVVVGYGYNAQGRHYQLAGIEASYWRANTRDGVDHVTSETLGNGLVTTRGYAGTSARLTSLQTGAGGGNAVQNDSYGYDSEGSLASRSNRMGANPTVAETLAYDLLNRLTSSSLGLNYSYDALGNLTGKTGVGSGTAGSYNYATNTGGCNATAGPHAVRSIAGISGNFCYDGNGNLVSGNGLAVTWTAYNLPATLTKSGVTDTFTYGPERQRLTHNQLPSATNITYAEAMELVTVGASTTLRTYLPQSVGVVVDSGTPTKQVLYFHRDHLGSTTGISNAGGALVESLAYDPWGKRRNLDGTPAGPIQPINDRYGYTGHEMLDGIGLVHMKGRVFNPFLGRFTSPDPYLTAWDQTQGFNRYAYVQNRPLTYTDPTGYSGETYQLPPVKVTGPNEPTGGTLWTGFGTSITLIRLSPNFGTGSNIARAAYRIALSPIALAVLRACAGPAVAGCVAVGAGVYVYRDEISALINSLQDVAILSENGKEQGKSQGKALGATTPAEPEREKTPSTDPDNFEPVRGTKGKKDKETVEIWEKDKLHRDHWEVYGDKRDYEKGKRDRDVWDDGRPKRKF